MVFGLFRGKKSRNRQATEVSFQIRAKKQPKESIITSVGEGIDWMNDLVKDGFHRVDLNNKEGTGFVRRFANDNEGSITKFWGGIEINIYSDDGEKKLVNPRFYLDIAVSYEPNSGDDEADEKDYREDGFDGEELTLNQAKKEYEKMKKWCQKYDASLFAKTDKPD